MLSVRRKKKKPKAKKWLDRLAKKGNKKNNQDAEERIRDEAPEHGVNRIKKGKADIDAKIKCKMETEDAKNKAEEEAAAKKERIDVEAKVTAVKVKDELVKRKKEEKRAKRREELETAALTILKTEKEASAKKKEEIEVEAKRKDGEEAAVKAEKTEKGVKKRKTEEETSPKKEAVEAEKIEIDEGAAKKEAEKAQVSISIAEVEKVTVKETNTEVVKKKKAVKLVAATKKHDMKEETELVKKLPIKVDEGTKKAAAVDADDREWEKKIEEGRLEINRTENERRECLENERLERAKFERNEQLRIEEENKVKEMVYTQVDTQRNAEEDDAEVKFEGKRKMQMSEEKRLEEEALMLNREILLNEEKRLKEEKTQLQTTNKVRKWMSRLSFKPDNKNSDLSSNAATVGKNDSNAFPKVLFDDGGEIDSLKEPEIGSI